MYSIRAHQSNKWKRFFRSHLIEAWLLGLISLWGCFQTTQVKEDDDNVAYSSIIRPIDIDTSTAKEIGREALKKIGYNEIIKLSEQAGFVQHKADVRIQLASYESVTVAGFVPVFSRYAVAAAVASQADSPLPGPADIAAVGVVVIGLVDAGLLDGYLLSTVGEWLVGTRGTLLMSQARADDEERRGPSGKEGRGAVRTALMAAWSMMQPDMLVYRTALDLESSSRPRSGLRDAEARTTSHGTSFWS